MSNGAPDPLAELLTTAQAAVVLGVTPGQVGRLVRAGALTARRPSSRLLLLDRAEVERYAAAPRRRGGWPKGRQRGIRPDSVCAQLLDFCVGEAAEIILDGTPAATVQARYQAAARRLGLRLTWCSPSTDGRLVFLVGTRRAGVTKAPAARRAR